MFKDYTIKEYMKLCFLVLRQNVTPEQFSNKFNMSNYEYTVTKEKMKELQSDYGISFSFKDKSIDWKIIDELKYEASKRGMWSFYLKHRLHYQNADHLVRSLYIAKRLLLSKSKYINLDELTQEMGFSRSSLREPIKHCRAFLASYEIEMKNIPHYGISVKGNEWNIRRCLIAIYTILDVSIVQETDYPEIRRALSSKGYSRVKNRVRNFIEKEDQFEVSKTQLRKLSLYLILQNYRMSQGKMIHDFDNIDPKIIQYVKNSKSLWNMSKEILDDLETKNNYGAYSEIEVLSLALMLLETFESENEITKLITTIYPLEQQELMHVIDTYLLDSFSLKLSNEYEKLVKGKVSHFILMNHMNVLKERSSNINGQTTLTARYPLIAYIYKDIRKLLSDYVHFNVSISCSVPICYLIALYIQNLSYKAPLLKIGVTARTDLYSINVMKTNLQKHIDKNLCRSIEYCEYDEMLNDIDTARKKYDVILCDERLSGDPLFLSYQEINYDFDYMNVYLKMHRNLCVNSIDEKGIQKKNLYISKKSSVQKELYKSLKLCNLSENDVFTHSVVEEKCIVLIVPQKDLKVNHLQFGELDGNVVYNKQKLSKYLIFIGNVNANNIHVINLILYELIRNTMFWNAFTHDPSIRTINKRLNRLLY